VGGELQLTDAIERLASTGKRVIGVSLKDDERRLDIGSLETMLEALKVSLSHVEKGSKADSGPREVILPNGPQEMEPTRSSRTPSRKRSAVPLQGTERTTRHRGG
jgi:dTDP-glucose pyrophosphorylase